MTRLLKKKLTYCPNDTRCVVWALAHGTKAELVSELLKYLRICYSYFLVLAGDPPVPDMIYLRNLPKYFHDFTNFIYQDRKIPAQSCSNTNFKCNWQFFQTSIL